MKKLYVPFLNHLNAIDAIGTISSSLDKLQKESMEYAPWITDFPYKPLVEFSMGHSGDCIFLKYYNVEKFIRAAEGNNNGQVWKDSCVEFFVSFDENGYYNFEFNCIGTTLIGFRKTRENREHLPVEAIKKIRYQALIKNSDHQSIEWHLTLAIPLEVFIRHDLKTLHQKDCRANFYKCGDGLPQPHYLCWSDINSPKPDFHLPHFFGSLHFES